MLLVMILWIRSTFMPVSLSMLLLRLVSSDTGIEDSSTTSKEISL